jgi:lipopolysaccharide/colanic/teichoic acid biosynthesis glycosyltransferase
MKELETGRQELSYAGILSSPRGADYLLLKRVVDISVASFLLVLFGPLMLLIALAIRLYSPGPVLFRQERVGKDGTLFYMLKFRSMRVGSDTQAQQHREHVQRLIKENVRPEDLGAASLKLNGDRRITGLGRILRKLSLDELPQLINVLRGEMSIVGPRPPLPYEYELYNGWHKQRMQVLPGITGLWQVTARNRVSFDEMVHIDLEYIESMNLWLDLQIMVRTPVEMVRGKGGG